MFINYVALGLVMQPKLVGASTVSMVHRDIVCDEEKSSNAQV